MDFQVSSTSFPILISQFIGKGRFSRELPRMAYTQKTSIIVDPIWINLVFQISPKSGDLGCHSIVPRCLIQRLANILSFYSLKPIRQCGEAPTC